uniref:Uncharacterized protein n=1 Tax=viral metagenome TaxID=1070528 RepID=A0A6H1ZQY3_9ZZZZ
MYTKSLGAVVMSEDEGREILSKMQFLYTDSKAKSFACTGFLNSIKTGEFMDMWDNLNTRKAGLDSESKAIFDTWASMDPITPTDLNQYYPAYVIINEKYKAMYNFLSKVASDPKEYKPKYDTPEIWENFLNMILIQTPEAAAKGAVGAGGVIAFGLIPIIGIGLFALYMYGKTKG